jgi:hypothetical protein
MKEYFWQVSGQAFSSNNHITKHSIAPNFRLSICIPSQKPKIFIDHVIQLIRLVQKIDVVDRALTGFSTKIVSTPHHARQTLEWC